MRVGSLSLAPPVCRGVDNSTRSAPSRAPTLRVATDVSVSLVEGVSSQAVSLLPLATPTVSSAYVLGVGYRLKVPRVHARWVSAEVVDDETGRNGPSQNLVRNTVSGPHFLGPVDMHHHDTVAIAVFGKQPLPAASACLLGVDRSAQPDHWVRDSPRHHRLLSGGGQAGGVSAPPGTSVSSTGGAS